MLYAINYAVVVSFLAVLCSPLWKNIFRDSGIKRRLFSHILFLPVYVIVGTFLLDDINLYINGNNLHLSLSLLNGLFFYVVIFFIYESILGIAEHSVSAEIFIRILQSQKSNTKITLLDIINEEEQLMTRIDGLLREKLIESQNKRYRATKKGKKSAKILACIKNNFGKG